MPKGKHKEQSLNDLYSMTELPPAETVRLKSAPVAHQKERDPLWAEYNQDDRDLLFSQSLFSIATKASRQQQQTIKEFIEEDIAVACADTIKQQNL